MVKKNEPEVPESVVSEHALVGAVRGTLARSPDVSTAEITIQAIGDTVHLTGFVKTLYEKQEAGRLAKQVDGVRRVENNLAVAPGKDFDEDEEIRQAVEEALGNFPGEGAARIGVRIVDSGIVYLSGKADSAEQSRQAAELAARVPGVKSIINEIDIAPGEPRDDIEIRNLVVDALSEDPRVDPFSIEVRVVDGDVCLDGDVEDEEAVEAATELAGGAAGVKRVFNRLVARSG